ncbi:hypothetical protein [Larkinella rosea]|uniref:Carboxypeptidase regulatory-like domain-containing protein n=1 Tax=Larkinella rosea TaxID=2025312 RepID=A0A3P1C1R8_9BACT|nr:hypothetical protein [Larkinella rosea]RRB07046.1 hypothetical protein EHT25_04495 [Larkinella rosea]
MRTISTLRMLVWALVLTNCQQTNSEVERGLKANPQTGYVAGKVTDTEGKPMKGARAFVDNTIYYNSRVSDSSDASGNCPLNIPAGSVFKAYAKIEKEYNVAYFKIELHPRKTDAIGNDDRVVRNFFWELSGEKTSVCNAFYGGEGQLYMAKHKPSGRNLQVLDGSDHDNPYGTSVNLDFFGQHSPISCDNCVKVQYRES